MANASYENIKLKIMEKSHEEKLIIISKKKFNERNGVLR